MRDFVTDRKHRATYHERGFDKPHFNLEVDLPFTGLSSAAYLVKCRNFSQLLLGLYKDKGDLKFIVRVVSTDS